MIKVKIITALILFTFLNLKIFCQENRYYITLTKLYYIPDKSGGCLGDLYAPLWLHIYYADTTWSKLDVTKDAQNVVLYEKPYAFRLVGRIGKAGAGIGIEVGPDDESYNNGDENFNLEIGNAKTDGGCTRRLDAGYNVLVDDPIVIDSVYFIDAKDKKQGNYACLKDNYRIKVITSKYYENSKSYKVLQVLSGTGVWQTLPGISLNSNGDTKYFSYDDLSAYIELGKAIRFRTAKILEDNYYSYSTSTNYLYYFPNLDMDDEIEILPPDCFGDSSTIKIPAPTTGDYKITVSGAKQGNSFNAGGLANVGGYYYITNGTLDANGKKTSIQCGQTYTIKVEYDGIPCPYIGTFNIPRVPQFILSPITYQTRLKDNNGDSVHISTINGKGRVNFSVDSSRTLSVQIIAGSTSKYINLFSSFLYNGNTYYRGSGYIDLPKGTFTLQAKNAYCSTNTQTATLAEPNAISFVYKTTNISCNSTSISGNQNDGKITISNLSGGIGPYTISPTASLVNGNYEINGLSYRMAGSYVVVYDNYGNEETKNIHVNYNSAVSMNFSNDTAPTMYCVNNGKVTVSASGGVPPYTYSKINSSEYYGTDNSLYGFSSGKQPVYVMDSKNCIFVDTAIIPEAPPSIAIQSIITPPVCYGNDNGYYTAIISNILGTMTVSSSDPRIFSSDIFVSGDTIVVKDLEAGTYSIDITDTYNGNSCDTTLIFEITEKPALSISSVISPVIGKGTATGKIDLAISGGNPGKYSVYLLDNNYSLIDSLFILNNNASFDSLTGQFEDGGRPYHIDITDSMSCSYIIDNGDYYLFKIREPEDTLNLSLLLTSGITCNGESDAVITTVAKGGWGYYKYSREKSGTFPVNDVFSDISMGQQYFYVIDSMGAIDSASIIINMPEVISAEISSIDSVKCYGTPTGSVHFNIAGGTPPYRNSVIGEQWQSGNISTGLSEGNYTFIYTDTNNCIAKDTLYAYVPTPDSLQFANIEVMQSTCNTNNAYIKVELEGGTRPYSYLWYDYVGNMVGTTALIDSLEQSGYYYLNVSDRNGCTQHFEQAINPSDGPSITGVDVEHVKCYGGSTGKAKVLEVVPANPYAPWWLNWSNGSTSDSSSGFPVGLHYVSVTDTNHCVFTSYFRVTSPDSLWTSVIDYKDAHCFGYNDGHIQVLPHGGVGGYSYSWSNGDLTNIADSLSVGIYTVTLYDTNQCSNSDTYSVSQPDLVAVNLGEDFTICPNNVVTLDGQDFTTHEWSTSQEVISDERFISIGSENDYYLEVTNDSGCYAYDTIHISVGNDALKAYFLMTSAAYMGDTLYIFELSNMELDSLNWDYDQNAFIDVTDNLAAGYVLQLANGDTGIFNVKLTAYSGGCISEAIKQVEIMYDNDSTDEEYFFGYEDPLITSFIVSPNPNEGTFAANINLREEADIELVIYSINYGEIVNNRLEYGLKEYELNYSLTDLPSGVYIIILNAGNERKQVKMIIQQL